MVYSTFLLTQPVGKLIKFKGRNYYIPTKINVETNYDTEILRKFLNASNVTYTIAYSSTVRRGRPPRSEATKLETPSPVAPKVETKPIEKTVVEPVQSKPETTLIEKTVVEPAKDKVTDTETDIKIDGRKKSTETKKE